MPSDVEYQSLRSEILEMTSEPGPVILRHLR